MHISQEIVYYCLFVETAVQYSEKHNLASCIFWAIPILIDGTCTCNISRHFSNLYFFMLYMVWKLERYNILYFQVTPGSLAAKCGLQQGDVILKIGNRSSDTLKHKDAQDAIVSYGNKLDLLLQR